MRNLSIVLTKVDTIANKIYDHIFLITVFLNFMKPVAYMIEGVLFVDIVNDQCGLTVFIEQFGD